MRFTTVLLAALTAGLAVAAPVKSKRATKFKCTSTLCYVEQDQNLDQKRGLAHVGLCCIYYVGSCGALRNESFYMC